MKSYDIRMPLININSYKIFLLIYFVFLYIPFAFYHIINWIFQIISFQYGLCIFSLLWLWQIIYKTHINVAYSYNLTPRMHKWVDLCQFKNSLSVWWFLVGQAYRMRVCLQMNEWTHELINNKIEKKWFLPHDSAFLFCIYAQNCLSYCRDICITLFRSIFFIITKN